MNFVESLESTHEFAAISNLLFDRTSHTTKSFLNETIKNIVQDVNIGSTTWINGEQADAIRIAVQDCCQTSYQGAGGSAANTIAGLRAFGAKVSISGSLAEDYFEELYTTSLKERGIIHRPTPPQNPSLGSGTCTIFITEDDSGTSERTMLTNLGVSGEVILSDADIEFIGSAKWLLVEGYLFEPESTYNSMCRAAQKMKDNKKKVAITLSADFCVRKNLKLINEFITEYADIVVGNNTEAMILTGSPTPGESSKILQKRGLTGAVTCGNMGAFVFDQESVCFIPSPKVEEVVDTTGAGDQFFAGFIFRLFQGGTIQEAGRFGAECAGNVIKTWGAQPANNPKLQNPETSLLDEQLNETSEESNSSSPSMLTVEEENLEVEVEEEILEEVYSE